MRTRFLHISKRMIQLRIFGVGLAVYWLWPDWEYTVSREFTVVGPFEYSQLAGEE